MKKTKIVLFTIICLLIIGTASVAYTVKAYNCKIKHVTNVSGFENMSHELSGYKSTSGDMELRDIAKMYCITITGKFKKGARWKTKSQAICEIFSQQSGHGPKAPTDTNSKLGQCRKMAEELRSNEKIKFKGQFRSGTKTENGHGWPPGLYVSFGCEKQ